MSRSILSESQFHDEEAAYAYVEARIWPRGPVCPHCGGVEKNKKMGGKSTRIGVYKCYDCRKPFAVKIDHLRSQPYPNECLAAGDLPCCQQQERNFIEPASPH